MPRRITTERPETAAVSARALQRVSERLGRRLDLEPVLPFPTIQYFLSETGPARTRIDPRELRAALSILAGNPAPGKDLPQGPWEPQPGIYVSPGITKRNSRANADVAAITKMDQMRAFADSQPQNRGLLLASVIGDVLPKGCAVEAMGADDAEGLAGGVEWNAGGARVSIPARGKRDPVSLWITNNVAWIFPDDPGLWGHLVSCQEAGARPLIIARKLPLATFTLLSRLGSFGVQLHHLFLSDGMPKAALAKRALASGPQILRPGDVQKHAAIGHLRKAVQDPGDTNPAASEAIRLGRELGLTSQHSGGLRSLREWVQRTAIELPRPWKAQLTKYERWTSVGTDLQGGS